MPHAARTAAPETARRLVHPLISIAKSTRAVIALFLAEIGLHPGQDQLLQTLEPNGFMTVSALADHLAIRPSTVSKMLDRLTDRGLVHRIDDARDGRRTMVGLTVAGVEVRGKVAEVWQRLERDLLAKLPLEETEPTLKALATVDELLVQRLRRLR